METPSNYADLREILSDVQRSGSNLRSVWCAPSITFETKVIQKRGITFGGAWSPQFIRWTDGALNVPFIKVLWRPHILLAETVVGSLSNWLPIFEQIAKNGESLLIATERINDALLRTLIVNSARDSMVACVVRLEGSIVDKSIAFGKPFNDPPQDSSQMPTASEAWIRKDATVVFPDSPQDCQSVTEDISIIEVGGDDFNDQQSRLRFLSDLIRRSEWLDN